MRSVLAYCAVQLCSLCVAVSCPAQDTATAIDAVRRAHDISAAAYFIVSPDKLEQHHAFGTTAWESGEPFAFNHLIRIGSISKTVTAVAAMVLVERGELSLASEVRDILPDTPFENPWRDRHPVKVAHLMEHTAGLMDLSKKEFDFNQPVSLAQAFAVDPSSRRLAWPAGFHSSYSNSGAGVLSQVIEQTTKENFEKFVREAVFAPLAMSSARFSLDGHDWARLVKGYGRDGRTPIPYWHTLYRGFGGVSVTPRDMVPFVQLFLNGGRTQRKPLLTQATIDRMQSPKTTLAARAGLAYGYGLGLYQFQRHGISFFGHGGDADGYLAYFAYAPTLRRGYFVVINAFNNIALRQMRRIIENSLVDAHKSPVLPGSRVDLAQLETLAGSYREVTHRFPNNEAPQVLVVSITDGQLFTQGPGGSRRALVAHTPWHFRRQDQTMATVAFVPCGNKLYLQGDFGNFVKELDASSSAVCP